MSKNRQPNSSFPPELAPLSDKEFIRYFIGSLFPRKEKRHLVPSAKSFVPPGSFADHLDFFMRFCAACDSSKIYIQAYTRDVMDGDIHLHRRGDILMEIKNIGDYNYNPQYWPKGYVSDVKKFIYENPGYHKEEDKLRLTFREPDSFILNYRKNHLWRQLYDLMRQYNNHAWISDVSAADSAEFDNWTGLLIYCGIHNSDLRYEYHDQFWYHVEKKRAK